MKVRANTRLVHNGQHVEAGKVIELTEEQVAGLGEDVTVVPEQGRRGQAPTPPPPPPPAPNDQNEQTNSDPAKTDDSKEPK